MSTPLNSHLPVILLENEKKKKELDNTMITINGTVGYSGDLL